MATIVQLRVQLDHVVLAEATGPVGVKFNNPVPNGLADRKLHRMALAVVEADGFDASETLQRPGQAYGGILPAGKQHQGGVGANRHLQ